MITDTRPWTHEGSTWMVELENGVGNEKTPPGVKRPITIAGVRFTGPHIRFRPLEPRELPRDLKGASDDTLADWFRRARKLPEAG
jgi:hypothetical protein